jgi:phage shock protein PspC (stress-responsive transcriptional regulator)
VASEFDPGVTLMRWQLPQGKMGWAAKEEDSMSTSLTRPREGKMIAGVCAGLAERFGWNANAVRLLFVLSCLLPGPQIVIYLALWVIMPKRPY